VVKFVFLCSSTTFPCSDMSQLYMLPGSSCCIDYNSALSIELTYPETSYLLLTTWLPTQAHIHTRTYTGIHQYSVKGCIRRPFIFWYFNSLIFLSFSTKVISFYCSKEYNTFWDRNMPHSIWKWAWIKRLFKPITAQEDTLKTVRVNIQIMT
jgi:hypothetical protein